MYCGAGDAPTPAAAAFASVPAQAAGPDSAPTSAATEAKPGAVMTECPVCQRLVPMATAESHVDGCMRLRQHDTADAAAGRKRSAPSQGV